MRKQTCPHTIFKDLSSTKIEVSEKKKLIFRVNSQLLLPTHTIMNVGDDNLDFARFWTFIVVDGVREAQVSFLHSAL